MNEKTGHANPPGAARAAIAAALLGAALLPGVAQAQRPTLTFALDPEKVAEGARSGVSIEVSGATITPAVASNCQAVVRLNSISAEDEDYRLVDRRDVLQLRAGETEFSGVEVEALQDADADDETVKVSLELQCGGLVPAPANEIPYTAPDVTLTIDDDDNPAPPPEDTPPE